MRAGIVTAAVIVLAGAGHAQPAPQSQSRAVAAPSATYLAGRQARLGGRLDEAETLLLRAVATNPRDYLALYNLGLVYEARARQATRGPARVAQLRSAAKWLEAARANLGDDYTIFNTLGYVYLQLGDLSTAEARFEAGLTHADKLSPTSRGKLLGNLGYVRALRGDTGGAVKLLERAAMTGNTNAIDNLARLKSAR